MEKIRETKDGWYFTAMVKDKRLDTWELVEESLIQSWESLLGFSRVNISLQTEQYSE